MIVFKNGMCATKKIRTIIRQYLHGTTPVTATESDIKEIVHEMDVEDDTTVESETCVVEE